MNLHRPTLRSKLSAGSIHGVARLSRLIAPNASNAFPRLAPTPDAPEVPPPFPAPFPPPFPPPVRAWQILLATSSHAF